MIGKFFSTITNQILAGIIALLVALLIVQTVRLEGLKIWPLSIEGCGPKAKRLQSDLDRVKEAQETALQKAVQAKEQAEQNYRDLAKGASEHEKEIRHEAMAAAEQFITANRVHPKAVGSSSSGSASATYDYVPGVSEDLSSDTFVVVRDTDVRACTEWVSFGIAARSWALKLTEGN